MLKFESNVFLAPMAGITDLPMRKIVKSFGSGSMFSEMVAINAITRKNPKSYRIADVRNEAYPITVQLVGGDEDLFPDSVKLMEELGAYTIDINMGCPVRKIINNQSGSYLMKDIKKAEKIIKASVKNSKLPISVKFRKGWDNNSINAVDFAKMCEASGASFITIHGRTRSQGYSGVADWNIIKSVKEAVKIPVIGNGDITSPSKAKEMIEKTNVDGIMIGRAALGQPWLISQINDYINNNIEPSTITIDIIKQTLLSHIKELVSYYGEELAIPISRKHACWYCKNLRDAKRFRETYMKVSTLNDAITTINNYFQL